MKPPEERLGWRLPLSAAEVDAAIRQSLWIGIRLLIVCLPLAWLACVPLTRWMTFAFGRAPSWHLSAILAVLIIGYPLLFLCGTAWLAWRRPSYGCTFRVDEIAIRWGDKSRHWAHVQAAKIDRDAAGRPKGVRLLSDAGRTHDVTLSNEPALADAAAAFIAARVPTHDAATHGPLDLATGVPVWATAVLIAACAPVVASVAWLGYERAGLWLGTITAAVIFVPVAWYAGTRPFLGRLQRDRASGFAIAAILTTALLAFCVVAAPMMRRLAVDLQNVPADERDRVSRTFPTNAGRH